MTELPQANTIAKYDPWKPQTWPRSHYYWWMFALGCMAFVWFTPKDVLDKYPQFVPFTDFMASWNPQVRRVGEISGALNQVNRFCSAVLWCVMPVIWLKLLFNLRDPENYYFGPVLISVRGLYLLIIIPIFVYLILWALPYPTSRPGRFIFINPLGRSLMIPGMVYLTGLLVLTWLRMATIWLLHMTGKNIR
jgi:hypothetical protein